MRAVEAKKPGSIESIQLIDPSPGENRQPTVETANGCDQKLDVTVLGAGERAIDIVKFTDEFGARRLAAIEDDDAAVLEVMHPGLGWDRLLEDAPRRRTRPVRARGRWIVRIV